MRDYVLATELTYIEDERMVVSEYSSIEHKDCCSWKIPHNNKQECCITYS